MSSKRALNSSSSAASSSFSSSKRSKLDEDVLVGEEVVDGDVDLPSHYDSLTANELYAEALNEMSAVESLASATEREVQTRAVTRLFELALDKFGVSCDLLHLVDKARCQRDFGAFLKVKEYITTALDTFVKLIGKEETDSLRLETLKTRLQLLLLTVGKQVEDLEKEAEEEEEDGDDNEDGEDDIGSDSASVLSKQDAKMLGQLVLELSNVHYNICEAETFSLYFMIRDLFLYLTSSKIKGIIISVKKP